jgi:3-oxoacyl-[acyl-carrier-protein] synthase II
MGAVSPVGLDAESTWTALLAGTSGGGPVTLWETTEEFACRIGCEVKGFDALDYMEKRDAKRFDRVSLFSIAASAQALSSAGLPDGAPDGTDASRFGVIFGSGIGGIATFEKQHKRLLEGGPKRVSPFFIPMFIPDMSAGLISMRWNLRGPNYATVSACASSTHAIGDAARHIQHGDTDDVRRLFFHEGPVYEKRRSGGSEPTVFGRARRIRDGRGRGRPRIGGPGPRTGARREDSRGDRGIWPFG